MLEKTNMLAIIVETVQSKFLIARCSSGVVVNAVPNLAIPPVLDNRHGGSFRFVVNRHGTVNRSKSCVQKPLPSAIYNFRELATVLSKTIAVM